jgi:molecular chaperone IbpA
MNDKENLYNRKGQFPWEKPYPNPYEPHPHGEWDKQKPTPPKPVTIADLFPRVDRWGIGILNQLDSLKSIADAKPSYPPYNIIRDKSLGDRWEIDIAVAGFRKDELEVSVEDRTLIVRTDPSKDFAGPDIREVIHQGIAQRNFELKFALAEYIQVTKVELKDGLLSVILEQELPEEKKPKIIDIE